MLAMYDGILACGDEESEAEGDGELAGGEGGSFSGIEVSSACMGAGLFWVTTRLVLRPRPSKCKRGGRRVASWRERGGEEGFSCMSCTVCQQGCTDGESGFVLSELGWGNCSQHVFGDG